VGLVILGSCLYFIYKWRRDRVVQLGTYNTGTPIAVEGPTKKKISSGDDLESNQGRKPPRSNNNQSRMSVGSLGSGFAKDLKLEDYEGAVWERADTDELTLQPQRSSENVYDTGPPVLVKVLKKGPAEKKKKWHYRRDPSLARMGTDKSNLSS
jgi:hypothetical protein